MHGQRGHAAAEGVAGSLLGIGGAGRGRIRPGGPASHEALFRLLPVRAGESWVVADVAGRRGEVDHPGVVESARVVPGLDVPEVGAEQRERGGDALPGPVADLGEEPVEAAEVVARKRDAGLGGVAAGVAGVPVRAHPQVTLPDLDLVCQRRVKTRHPPCAPYPDKAMESPVPVSATGEN